MPFFKLSEIIQVGQSCLTTFGNLVIIVKGSWAKVGSDISTSLKMTGLQSWSIEFSSFNVVK